MQDEKKVIERYGEFAEHVLNDKGALAFNQDGLAPRVKLEAGKLAERVYSEDELGSIQQDAVDASIACGNPLDGVKLQPGETVLDLGCGGGMDCFLAASEVGPAGRVIGIDATPGMIELANRNKANTDIRNVEFHIGNIEDLPVNTGSVDVIISNCVIDISSNKKAVFAEAYRVLKPGGRMSISDTVICGKLPEPLKSNVDEWAGALITPLETLECYLEFITGAGFENIQVNALTSYGLEAFEELDEASRTLLTRGMGGWTALPENTGLYSARISATRS